MLRGPLRSWDLSSVNCVLKPYPLYDLAHPPISCFWVGEGVVQDVGPNWVLVTANFWLRDLLRDPSWQAWGNMWF